MTTALVVDDIGLHRRVAGEALKRDPELGVRYASNGLAAMAAISRDTPDLVITDLEMPKMNGLELVGEIRRRHPSLPVILMTPYGSERTAVEALRRGAASFVAKRDVTKKLRQTVKQVLAATAPVHRDQRPFRQLAQAELTFRLGNDPAAIPPLVSYLQEHLASVGVCDRIGQIRTGIALEGALTNALYHGNLEAGAELHEDGGSAYYQLGEERRSLPPYRDRHIHVVAKLTSSEAVFIIRDEGPGFDPTALPDPADPGNIEKSTGRGLLLVHTFMDEVKLNELGNEIKLIRRRRDRN